MNQTEFLRFEGELDKRLPSVSAWLQRIETEVMAETMATWFTVLERTDLVDAVAVLADLQAERVAWPMPWDRLPGVIALQAKHHSRNRAMIQRSKEDTRSPFVCQLCDNSGWVYVWMSDVIEAVQKGQPAATDGFAQQTATRCKCPKGDTKTASVPQFDPTKFVAVRSTAEEDINAWLGERGWM